MQGVKRHKIVNLVIMRKISVCYTPDIVSAFF